MTRGLTRADRVRAVGPGQPPRAGLPSITVITVCLNARETLPLTLESVRAQRYPHLEHLVVDGGSTDGTVELLANAPGIRYVSEPDRGLSDAMNKGVRLANGDVVAWLHADDLYRPGALSRVGEVFANSPEARWVTSPCPIIDAAGRETRRPVTAYKRMLLRHYSYRLLLTQNFIPHPATFVRRSALEDVGLFDERFRYSMDYDLWLRLGRRWDPMILEEPLAVFRMAPGSLSMQGFERQFAEHAQNAREHGAGHPAAVAANRVISRAIVLVYRLMRRLRAKGQPRTGSPSTFVS